MDGITTYRQPWIGQKWVETVFILLPPFASLAFIALFPALFRDNDSIPDAWWVVLILLIDVAHVYSTLYRTYFDPSSFRKYRRPLLLIPVLAFVGGVALYAAGPLLFWRILAYLAVFHFIRQQYGFLRIYSREEVMPRWRRWIDTWTIYYATIYPLLYWHLGETRHFNWFVEDDFLLYRSRPLLAVATGLYIVTLVVYVLREVWSFFFRHSAVHYRYINLPRVAILLGTILSWYFGIVYFNGDMAFTLLNVVSHGIPYMALVWLFGYKRYGGAAGAGAREERGAATRGESRVVGVREEAAGERHVKAVRPAGGNVFLRKIFSRYGIVLFLGIIFLLAYLEEGLWDMTVWKEHVSLFAAFHLVKVRVGEEMLTLLVPLLALPQVTHYIIDGVIWRRGK